MNKLRNLAPLLGRLDTRIARPAPKTVDPHYLTPEHRAWRAEVIRRSGRRCQDPRCAAPDRSGITLYADHVKELQDGGAPFDPQNGLARCGSCHTRKTFEERARRMATPT